MSAVKDVTAIGDHRPPRQAGEPGGKLEEGQPGAPRIRKSSEKESGLAESEMFPREKNQTGYLLDVD